MRWSSCLRNRASLPAIRFSFFFAPLVFRLPEPLPLEVVLPADRLDGRAGVGVAVAVGGDLREAEVDPEEVRHDDGRPFGQVHRGVEEEPALAIARGRTAP